MKTTTKTPAHLRHQTQFTKTGERDMSNRKPYRTKRQKADARKRAVKLDTGQWASDVPVSYHY